MNCNIGITDKFFVNYMELIRTKMLPYQWRVLNDEEDIVIAKERDADYIPAEKSHCVENFRIAAGRTKGHHYGMVFQDSDLYKWLEAVAYTLERVDDKYLRGLAEEAVDLIAEAQEEDGYLNTYFTIEAPERKFKRLYQSHELYCAGHFIEAAVAYYQAVDNQKVLDTAVKLADCIDRHFGPNGIKGYDGHEEIELALLRLYEVTKEKRYLTLAKFFLYERGKNPEFFQQQRDADPDKSVLIEGMDGFRPSYYQNHKPILQQETAEGHAVRVAYMCDGMARLAYLDNDKDMLEACQRLWQNITHKRMYITGAIGSTVIGEAFTADYDLPNDTVYGETCASVGLMFFAHNLMKSQEKGEYADVMEKALYNTVLSGMALDGKHFFYVNPLEVVPEYSHKDPGKSHIKTTRPSWFGCACCPPNLARLLSSLNRYVYTVKNDIVYANLYVSSWGSVDIAGQEIFLKQTTEYPKTGNIELEVLTDGEFGIAMRIPGWASDYKLQINGKECAIKPKDGYVVLHRSWHKNDLISLVLPMEAKFYQALPRVREDIGRVAVQRGPVVYCAESVDNGAELELLRVSPDMELQESSADKEFGGAVILKGKTEKVQLPSDEKLYAPYEKVSLQVQDLKLVPYYCWGNRGENEMLVWLYKK